MGAPRLAHRAAPNHGRGKLAGRGVDLAVTGAMTVACVIGALTGVRLATRVPPRQLGRSFAGLVTAVATYLLISAAFLGGPPGS